MCVSVCVYVCVCVCVCVQFVGNREELQVGQLPPGVAAQENEAKARRRDKRKAGELGGGMKQLHVAAGEEELWEVFAVSDEIWYM